MLAAALLFGFNVPCWYQSCYSEPRAAESLPAIEATGAKWVVLTPTCYMETVASSEIDCASLTPTDASVRELARKAKARGLSVALKPHVDCPGVTIRGLYRPADRGKWFASYRAMMARYARLAAEERLDMLVVGTELASLATFSDQAQWHGLIEETRRVYPGPLTFAADWYAVNAVTFWNKLDYIGVDAYFPLPPNKTAMAAGWRVYKGWLAALSALHGKKVLFTEFGLSSQKGASWQPMNFREFGPLDLQVQADYFETGLSAFAGENWFAGLWQWDWDMSEDAGGPFDKTMSVQGKPAQKVLERWFKPAAPSRMSPEEESRLEARVRAATETIKIE